MIGEGENALAKNPVFGAISNFIPGDDKVGFIGNTFGAVSGWMDNLVGSVGLTREGIFEQLNSFIEFFDEAFDFVAAFIDMSTNYFQHTGIQTVGKKLIQDAAEQI